MKTVHLVCNAHLDPVWMWDWDEGAAEAIATFYSAVKLAEEYDYIFCHNEAVLYEFVEKYAPELFEKIKKLVAAGKWHIMGGWYIQPDCTVPSGESFIRQITTGREYFDKKFGSRPTVAVNFDSFGHTRGLVQILKKCGYEGYVCCRPMPEVKKLPENPFLWVGQDGSEVKVLRIDDETIYCSPLGDAARAIVRKIKTFDGKDEALVLWGVGNHGGGASRKDLSDIIKLREEKKSEYDIIHSTPEAYFAAINPTAKIKEPLPCFIKSYSSISALKVKHAETENALYSAEKACAAAELAGKFTADRSAFIEAERMLCASEFHDILSGTCVKEGERSTIQKLEHAKELVKEEFLKAFHSLAKDYAEAKEGENPFVLFNFQPYARKVVAETEILIPNPLVSDTEEYEITMYRNGKVIPSQVIKESSNINYDRRKRIAYVAELAPLGVSRADLYYKLAPKKPKKADDGTGDFVIDDGVKKVVIDRGTGFLKSFVCNGKEYITGNSFVPVMFEDNADPWGWEMYSLGKNYRAFKPEKGEKTDFCGLVGARIVEDGEVLTEIECDYKLSRSFAKISYKVYKGFPYIDVNCYVLWNEKSRGLKLKISTLSGKYFGQVAYGTEFYKADGGENVSQRFVGVKNGENAFAVYSSGVYGNGKKGKDLYLTLFNGSAYCAHPIGNRPLLDETRFVPFIEQGKHEFNFRIGVNEFCECEKTANEFAEPPYSVNMYPHGNGEVAENVVTVDDASVVITAMKKRAEGGFIVRLFNNCEKAKTATVTAAGASIKVKLKKYSFETLVCENGKLTLSDRADLY